MTTETAEVADDDLTVDGRVLRGQRNREAIVEALLDIYASGNLRPTVAQVADAAGLSTRSVYHHFDDMKSLVLEVAARSEQDVISPDYTSLGKVPLEEKIHIFVRHRFQRWNATSAVVRAGLLAEYDSQVIAVLLNMSRQKRLNEVRDVFNPDLSTTSDAEATASGLDVIFGFETWHRMTQMHKLDQDRAAIVVARLASALF